MYCELNPGWGLVSIWYTWQLGDLFINTFCLESGGSGVGDKTSYGNFIHFTFDIICCLFILNFASLQIWGKHFPGTLRRNPSYHYLILWGLKTLNNPGQWFLGRYSIYFMDNIIFIGWFWSSIRRKVIILGLKDFKKIQVINLFKISLFPVSNVIPIKAVH